MMEAIREHFDASCLVRAAANSLTLLGEGTMLNSPGVRVLALTAAFAFTPLAMGAERVNWTVPWKAIHASLCRTMCVTFYDRGTQDEGYSPTTADRGTCLPQTAKNSIDMLVDRALGYLNERALLSAVFPEWNKNENLSGALSDQENSRILCDAALRSGLFQRRVLPQIYEELNREGLVCSDCPIVDRGPVREVPLDLFMSYVGAYAWPDKVQPELNADGQPTGSGEYSFHVCVGINGLSRIVPEDPEIAAAAWAAIWGLDVFHKRMNELYVAVFAEEAFLALASNPSSVERFKSETEYLREQLPARMASDSALRTGICSTLQQPHFREVLRLKVSGCDSNVR